MSEEAKPFCDECPDHEACMSGMPCELVISVNGPKPAIPKYSLGFAYCNEFRNGPEVLLIKKTHPEWQKGLLNGIGGKLEPEELAENDFKTAMKREAIEEVGLNAIWDEFSVLHYPDAEIHVFRAFIPFKDAFYTESKTDELISWMPMADLWTYKNKVISNLTFLIPLGFYTQSKFETVQFKEA